MLSVKPASVPPGQHLPQRGGGSKALGTSYSNPHRPTYAPPARRMSIRPELLPEDDAVNVYLWATAAINSFVRMSDMPHSDNEMQKVLERAFFQVPKAVKLDINGAAKLPENNVRQLTISVESVSGLPLADKLTNKAQYLYWALSLPGTIVVSKLLPRTQAGKTITIGTTLLAPHMVLIDSKDKYNLRQFATISLWASQGDLDIREITGQIEAPSRPHASKPQTFIKPTFCSYCSDLLMGVYKQGVTCTVCNQNFHEKCCSLSRCNQSKLRKTTSQQVHSMASLHAEHGGMENGFQEDNRTMSRLRHEVEESTFNKQTMCSFCNEVLTGVLKQGIKCADCGEAFHHRCYEKRSNTLICVAKHYKMVQEMQTDDVFAVQRLPLLDSDRCLGAVNLPLQSLMNKTAALAHFVEFKLERPRQKSLEEKTVPKVFGSVRISPSLTMPVDEERPDMYDRVLDHLLKGGYVDNLFMENTPVSSLLQVCAKRVGIEPQLASALQLARVTQYVLGQSVDKLGTDGKLGLLALALEEQVELLQERQDQEPNQSLMSILGEVARAVYHKMACLIKVYYITMDDVMDDTESDAQRPEFIYYALTTKNWGYDPELADADQALTLDEGEVGGMPQATRRLDDALACLEWAIDLAVLVDADGIPTDKSFAEAVAEFVHESKEGLYEQFLEESVPTEEVQAKKSDDVTETLQMCGRLSVASALIAQHVRTDMELYAHLFLERVDLDIIELNMQMLCTEHARQLEQTTSAMDLTGADKLQYVGESSAVFRLYRSVKELVKEFKALGITTNLYDDFYLWFLPAVNAWLALSSEKATNFAERGMEQDHDLCPSFLDDGVLHSHSMVFIFESFHPMVQFLSSLGWEDEQSRTLVLLHYTNHVTKILITYARWLLQRSIELDSEKKDQVVSQAFCTALNNVTQTFEQTVELFQPLGPRLLELVRKACHDAIFGRSLGNVDTTNANELMMAQGFHEAFFALNHTFRQIMVRLVNKLRVYIDERLEALLHYGENPLDASNLFSLAMSLLGKQQEGEDQSSMHPSRSLSRVRMPSRSDSNMLGRRRSVWGRHTHTTFDVREVKAPNQVLQKQLNELVEFMDRSLEIMCTYLYANVFEKVAPSLWTMTLQAFTACVTNNTGTVPSDMSKTKAQWSNDVLLTLRSLFHAEGDGLKDEQLDTPGFIQVNRALHLVAARRNSLDE